VVGVQSEDDGQEPPMLSVPSLESAHHSDTLGVAVPTAVSIVVPTLNRGPLLFEAVRSALDAPQPPHEVIVVDAGSTDGSVEQLAELAGPLRIIRGDYRNAAASRNAGAAVARGVYLGFLDSDDLMLPGKTSCLVDALDADAHAALAHGTTNVIGENGEPLPAETEAQRRAFARAERRGTSYPALAAFCAMFTSAALVRKAAFEAIGGYDESLDAYEDWDLYLRLSLDWELVYTDCLAAKYRVWRGNVGWRRTAEWTIRVAEKHLASLPELNPSEQRSARYAFLWRIASSRHVLVDPRRVRAAAVSAARTSPRRALLDRELRGLLVRSFLPERLLHARRPNADA
jgi:glycosyltransferase involved in cell wall biosynthesis